MNFGVFLRLMRGLELETGDIWRFFHLLCGMRRKSRISISLSDEVVEEVEMRRGLFKRSTFYESLIWKALDLEPEDSSLMTTKRTRRQASLS